MKSFVEKFKNIGIYIFWLCIVSYLIYVNANFRDVAQAWLIARDCTILELFKQLQYEGHMCLWYLILMPFAKLGFPYITSNIISIVITSISVLLILYKAPFKFYYRVLLVFSLPVLYIYPVISRCYCLLPLAIILMAMTYKDRKIKPYKFLLSVVFLANVHVITFGMVGMVLLEYMIEIIKDIKQKQDQNIKKRIMWFLIAIALICISGIPLLGCLNANKEVQKKMVKASNSSVLSMGKNVGVIIYQLFRFLVVNSKIVNILYAIVYITVLLLTINGIKEKPKDILKIFLIFFYQIFVYTYIYESNVGQQTLIMFIALYYIWIDKVGEKEEKVCDKISKYISMGLYIVVALIVLSIINMPTFSFYRFLSLIFSAPSIYIYSKPIVNYLVLVGVVALAGFSYKDRKIKPYKYLILLIFINRDSLLELGIAGIILIVYAIEIIWDIIKQKNNNILDRAIWFLLVNVFIWNVQEVLEEASIIFLMLYYGYISDNKRISVNYFKQKNIYIIILLSINVMSALTWVNTGIVFKSTNTYETATYINENLDDNCIITSGHTALISGVIPYMKNDIKFYHISGDRFFTYTIWDDAVTRDLHIEV